MRIIYFLHPLGLIHSSLNLSIDLYIISQSIHLTVNYTEIFNPEVKVNDAKELYIAGMVFATVQWSNAHFILSKDA